MARICGSLNLLVFIKISSIIKPEKILLLKPVIRRGDYRPCVVIGTEGDASLPGTVSTFDEIRQLTPRIGAEAAASARRELRRRRQAWNAADERIGYSASRARAQQIAQFEGIAGRILISLQPRHVNDIAAKLHYMLVNYDPELRKEEAPWPYLRFMLHELIQPKWSVIDPQSRIRWLRPRRRGGR
jgi:hypothetical protein